VFVCPSDRNTGVYTVKDESDQDIAQVASNSYTANYGTGDEIGELPDLGDGLFYRNSRVRIKDVTDGVTNTLALGERAALFVQSPWAGAVSLGMVRISPGAPVYTAGIEEAPVQVMAGFNNFRPLNDPGSTPYNFFSPHPHIVLFTFADGSARPLSSSIPFSVLQALATRAGGETVTAGDY
jgi:hypothetical protein